MLRTIPALIGMTIFLTIVIGIYAVENSMQAILNII